MDVHFNNASIDFVIEYLESATDYTFVYNDTDKEGVKITVSLKDADIVTILDAVFKDTPLAYQIKEDRIVVLRRKNNTVKAEEETGRERTSDFGKRQRTYYRGHCYLRRHDFRGCHRRGRRIFNQHSRRCENTHHQ